MATFQDQKNQDAAKKKTAAEDSAQRVEFTPNLYGNDLATIDNPNPFPLSNVQVEFTELTGHDVYIATSKRLLLPSCTQLRIDVPNALPPKHKGLFSKSEKNPPRARFTDRNGNGWTADGFNAFHAATSEGFSAYKFPMDWKPKEIQLSLNSNSLDFKESSKCK
ncbi:hypothetical protein ACKI1I_41025 [Streptomyces turgidiscabies]|uniref:hypothetical protein n=1 Tax=Streptomyces turgidiscabies TaxID=85558 RepID=UPI0038F68E89